MPVLLTASSVASWSRHWALPFTGALYRGINLSAYWISETRSFVIIPSWIMDNLLFFLRVTSFDSPSGIISSACGGEDRRGQERTKETADRAINKDGESKIGVETKENGRPHTRRTFGYCAR